MVDTCAKLAKLEQIARIRAEQELKKLAAFRLHVEAAQGRVAATRTALGQSYRDDAPLALSEARMANAQAARAAREMARAERDLLQMRPGFEAARQNAAREFGRAEVLAQLARREVDRNGHG
ncbi:hypothetical protein PAF17_14745 [Paracoccus sp. Z330]|uniref:Flagellar export protein FliJ n=1 Tax=Paracoccus onchidii TaxID=3017813 RepID=A0ABT4ZHB5_9RHOB|nr:hypothetical protein [Paracoccus onchidii]MDB6178753.1 hypothetical protein [Paracoccus onchidii]